MARLSTSEILGAVALGKRNSNSPTELPEVKITATKLTKGDPTYDIGGKQVSHSAIINAMPMGQRQVADKYLNTYRIMKGGTEKAGKGADISTSNYVLNGSGTKNDTYDMIQKVVQSLK